jgi:hypothetical protein
MENRRDCCEVIVKMVEKIPNDNVDLLKDLAWNYEDATYKAPEETIQWSRTMETLIKYIDNPTHDWQFEVWSIFTTKPIEQLKKEIAHE